MKQVNMENLKLVKADLEARLSSLRREEEVLSRDIEAVERMLERYGEQTSLEIGDPVSSHRDAEFKSANLREAVISVLRRHKPSSVRVPDIKKEVLSGGYHSTAKNLSPPIFGILNKIVKAGQAEKVGPGEFRATGE